MPSGRTITPADKLADCIRASVNDWPMPADLRTFLARSLNAYDLSTGYGARVARRHRRTKKARAA